MSELVSYKNNGNIAIITLDDGKANSLSPSMIKAINKALDQAENDKATIILTGREGKFCAGFDNKKSNNIWSFENDIGDFVKRNGF